MHQALPRACSTIIAMAVAVTSPAMWAQTPPPPRIVSPDVEPDRTVTFRLDAPQAHQVTISGDFLPLPATSAPLQRSDRGVWSLTTAPLRADVYSYTLMVDGLRMADPHNSHIKQGVESVQSALIIPGPEADFITEHDVPHGDIRDVTYISRADHALRHMLVYVPPHYQASRQRLPVVYLLHGGGDDYRAWASQTVGRVNIMLDNLIAQGRARPMIVVMPNLWMLPMPVEEKDRSGNQALFASSMRGDIIPFIDSHYRTIPVRSGRAFGGLGAGVDNLPDLTWATIDLFGTVFHVSGGARQERLASYQTTYPGRMSSPANVRNVRFFLGNGKDDVSLDSTRDMSSALVKLGYRVKVELTEGGHNWLAFRRSFYTFAQTAFK